MLCIGITIDLNQFNNVKNAAHIIGNTVKPKITLKSAIIISSNYC